MPEIPWDLVGLVLFGVLVYVMFFGGKVAPAEAKRLVSEGALLLDVRTPAEFGSGHIPGAVNIPVSDLPGRLAEVPGDKAVVVYCASGMRSASAKRILTRSGRKTVHDLGAMARYPS